MRLPKTEKETQLSFRLTGAEREVLDGLVEEWGRKIGRRIPLSRLIAASLDGYLPPLKKAAAPKAAAPEAAAPEADSPE